MDTNTATHSALRAALEAGAPLSAFTAYPRFIVYRLVWAPEKGKHDKIPCDHRTGQVANAHDTATQTNHHTALAAAERLGEGYGVGFAFNAAEKFFFLDIDNCLVDGAWSDVALQLLAMLPGAAVEVSVSGKGLHVFGRGIIPAHKSKNIPLHLELYHDGRFVALTRG
jgi:primase-polymerase (primpol)-like protein